MISAISRVALGSHSALRTCMGRPFLPTPGTAHASRHPSCAINEVTTPPISSPVASSRLQITVDNVSTIKGDDDDAVEA